MLYLPSAGICDLRLALGQGLIYAGLKAASDFLAGENKPWQYYAGIATAGTAAATGISGASLTVFAVGETLDALIFKSPEGGFVDVYLDGVAYGTVNTISVSGVWETFRVVLGGSMQRRIDFVNRPAPDGWAWMAIGAFTVLGIGAKLQERTGSFMAIPTLVSFSLTDSDGETSSLPIFVQSGLTLAQYETFVSNAAPLIDAVTGCKLNSASITIYPTLPNGLKASPAAGVENQRGANFLFNTGARYRHSIRVPGWLAFSGQTVNLEAAGVGAFIDMLVTGLAPVTPRDGYDNDLVSLARAVKSWNK